MLGRAMLFEAFDEPAAQTSVEISWTRTICAALGEKHILCGVGGKQIGQALLCVGVVGGGAGSR